MKAFFEYDNDEGVRRALAGRSRPDPGPWKDGDIVYWFRRQGTKTLSKRLQEYVGWHGPAVVLKQEGHSRVYISYRGVPVLVTPRQLRRASREELAAFDSSASLDELLQEGKLPSVRRT